MNFLLSKNINLKDCQIKQNLPLDVPHFQKKKKKNASHFSLLETPLKVGKKYPAFDKQYPSLLFT